MKVNLELSSEQEKFLIFMVNALRIEFEGSNLYDDFRRLVKENFPTIFESTLQER